MSLRSLIDNLADKKPEAFVAPIPAAERVSVRTIQDGVPYIFNVPSPRPGWWTLIPSGNKVARIDKLAEPHDVIDYLNALPRFYVIALYPTGETTWLVTPYNIADASQRGWQLGAPREVHLVRMQVESFDVLVARSLAGVLIFDDIDTRLGSHTIIGALQEALGNKGLSAGEASWRHAFQIVEQRANELLIEQTKAEEQQRVASTEEKIRWHLEFMGASLKEFAKHPRGYTVTWSAPDGNVYHTSILPNMHIEVAGFCLSGTDRVHNLSSLVHVMEEAVRQRRPDLKNAMRPRLLDNEIEIGYDPYDDED